jgi:cobalamin transport system substrate-binding protein
MIFPRGFLLRCAALLVSVSAAGRTQVAVIDDLGRRVTLAAPAQRVISLAPSITESLFAIGAGEQLVGVTTYCDYPPEASSRARVGGMTNPSIETILSLRPDLVALSMEGNTLEDFAHLTGLSIPVFVTNPRTLSGISHSIEQLGELTGHRGEAQRLVDSLGIRVARIRARTAGHPVRALLFVSLQPLIAAGRNTFLNEILEAAGAKNIAVGVPGTYPAYSREAVLAEDPDALILTSDLTADIAGLTALFPEWAGLSAVRKGRVYRVDPDIVSRPGPRAVDALEILFSLLQQGHP